MVISGFPALKDRLRDLPPKRAVVAAAHDEHTLQAVFAARRDGLIRPILVGHREEILSAARRLGEKPDPSLVVDAVLTAVVFWTHRSNIGRLRRGEEKSWRKSKN